MTPIKESDGEEGAQIVDMAPAAVEAPDPQGDDSKEVAVGRQDGGAQSAVVFDWIWMAALVLALLSMLLWWIVWLIWGNAWVDINDFLNEILGSRTTDFAAIILACITIVMVYVAGLLCWRFFLAIRRGAPWRMHVVHRVLVTLVILAAFALVGAFAVLWDAQFALVYRFSQRAVPPLQFILIILLTAAWLPFLSFVLPPRFAQRHSVALIAIYAVVYLFVFLIPAWYQSVHIVSAPIPPRPSLLGHRGARFLAPENTLASFEIAVERGVAAVESDVMISYDGVPFMMHDKTLTRTTNVADVFPEFTSTPAYAFTVDELKQLDAGSWFATSPFAHDARRALGDEAVEAYRGAKIPTLQEVAALLSLHPTVRLIFDLRAPPKLHPYASEYIDRTIAAMLAGGMQPAQVIWLTDYHRETFEYEMFVLAKKMPGATVWTAIDEKQALPDAAELLAAGITGINVNAGMRNDIIRAYQAGGLDVNTYVIDKGWLFSQVWLLGVNSTTTNEVDGLAAITAPGYLIDATAYLIAWLVVQLTLVASMVALPLAFRRRLGINQAVQPEPESA